MRIKLLYTYGLAQMSWIKLKIIAHFSASHNHSVRFWLSILVRHTSSSHILHDKIKKNSLEVYLLHVCYSPKKREKQTRKIADEA